MLDVNNYFICPVCGQSNITLNDSTKLFTDTLIDTLMCNSCLSEWRTYLKISELNIEIIKHVAQEEISS